MPYANPAVRRKYVVEWKRRNNARHKLLNKYADAAKHANKRANEYGSVGKLTAADVRDCLSSGKCHYCETVTNRLCIDHTIPLSMRGPNTRDNIVAACASCNGSKFTCDRPGKWSRDDDACRRCGTSEKPHLARGLCCACYQRRNNKRHVNETDYGRPIKESGFLGQVIDAARVTGWKVAHFRPAMTKRGWRTAVQGDGAGWPDCILVHPKKKRLIVCELKSETGATTAKQDEWLSAWAMVPCAEVWLLRPSDFDRFWEELNK